jgi:dTDP-4-amino-4,6-dideoxygalactose transaminase
MYITFGILGIHYPIPIHKLGAYAELKDQEARLPVATKQADCIISLPMFPEMTTDQQDKVVDTIKEFFASSNPVGRE